MAIPSASWAASRGEKWLATMAGTEAMIRPVNDPLIEALQLEGPCTIADIGCGGGGATIAIAAKAPVGSIVHGFDIAPMLIEAAKARTTGQRGVAFHVADATTATTPQPYDRLASRFGVMFFEDPKAAFTNLAQWLAPGGRFAFAVWGRVSENPWITTVKDAVEEVVPVPRADLTAPGPFRYADASQFVALLEECGFKSVEVKDWRGEIAIGGGLSAADAAQFALAAFSTFGELLAAAGGDAPERAEKALVSRFQAFEKNGVVMLGASVHVVTGTRE